MTILASTRPGARAGLAKPRVYSPNQLITRGIICVWNKERILILAACVWCDFTKPSETRLSRSSTTDFIFTKNSLIDRMSRS